MEKVPKEAKEKQKKVTIILSLSEWEALVVAAGRERRLPSAQAAVMVCDRLKKGQDPEGAYNSLLQPPRVLPRFPLHDPLVNDQRRASIEKEHGTTCQE